VLRNLRNMSLPPSRSRQVSALLGCLPYTARQLISVQTSLDRVGA
jgi:hypothetical protein